MIGRSLCISTFFARALSAEAHGVKKFKVGTGYIDVTPYCNGKIIACIITALAGEMRCRLKIPIWRLGGDNYIGRSF